MIAKPLAMRELSRVELPQQIQDKYPEATGGAWAQVKFLLDTPEGQGAYVRLKEGLVDEWSFGYDPIQVGYTTEETKEGKRTIRELREVKLYELSPVVWGMNSGTMTVSAKGDIEPEEGKPWRVFERDGKFQVYKVNEDGEPVGDALGTHDTRADAQAQVRALYANEPDEEMAGAGASEEAAGMTPEDRKDIIERLERIEALLMERDHDAPAEPERAAEDTPQDEDAGPVIPPTSERLAVLRQLEAELLEVE